MKFVLLLAAALTFSGCVLNPTKPGFVSLDSMTCVATESHLNKSGKAVSERVVLKHQISLSSEPVKGDYLVGLSKNSQVRYLVGVEDHRLNLGIRHHKADAAVARSFPDIQEIMSLSLEHPPQSNDIYAIDCRLRKQQ
jgi:hypothetical protein